MKTYEITYLTIHEDSNDAKTVSPILAHNQAKIVSVHPWGGRRKLAFPIKKQDQIFYTTVVFEAEPSALVPIERELQLNGDVIRDIIVDFVPGMFHRAPQSDEAPTRTERPAMAPVVAEEIAEVVTPSVEAEPAPVELTADTTETKEAAPKRRRATKAATTEDKAALDEKLDALLNEDLTK